jgi:hypothetical protein
MNLPRRLFWDVDYDKIDWDKKFEFVIVRVFERGDVEDIRAVRRYYTEEQVRKALTETKWLSKQTVYLACAILDNNLTDYRCYNIAQSNPQHWSY